MYASDTVAGIDLMHFLHMKQTVDGRLDTTPRHFVQSKKNLNRTYSSLKQLRLPVCHIDGVSLHSTPKLQDDSSIWISVHFSFRRKQVHNSM